MVIESPKESAAVSWASELVIEINNDNKKTHEILDRALMPCRLIDGFSLGILYKMKLNKPMKLKRTNTGKYTDSSCY